MMTEPATSTATTATALTIALIASLEMVDGSALIGSVAGAAIYGIHATDVGFIRRLASMLISIIAGYSISLEIAEHIPIAGVTTTALVVSALIVVIASTAINVIGDINKEDVLKWRDKK